MFVAGLNDSSSSTRDRSGSILSTATSSRRNSTSAKNLSSSAHLSAAPTVLGVASPMTSPGPSSTPLPNSPPVDELEVNRQLGEILEKDPKDKEFEDLVENLRSALMSKAGRGKVWLAEQERTTFRIVLVDKVSPYMSVLNQAKY
jgi:hypothetical protein